MKNLIIGALALALLASCGGGSKKPNEQALLDSLDNMESTEPEVSGEVIGDIIQQIPAPLEISVLIKEAGTQYDNNILNSYENVSSYNSNFKKALNLGIYGTDLGYANIYEQNQDAILYLNAVNELAEGLSIGQFFDFKTIKRLATNSSNLDSLLYITTKNFNDINKYLQNQRRANLSVLLLTGGWLEALHILLEVQKQNPDMKGLQETIGEQKIIMDNIMLLLSFYQESDPDMGQLMNDLKPLHDAFNKIEIVTTYQESTFEIIDGVMVVKDNSSSEIIITDDNIDEINTHTNKVRGIIVS